MGTATACVLFTDIVGSTALLQRLGEARGDELRRRHDELMGSAVSAGGGRVVKTLGDGVMAVFGSAAEAVAAAVAIQQAVDAHGRERPDEAFGVRVGVSVGDVSIDDDDLHGAAVVEAARLCDAAQGGQILVADLVRALARGRGDVRFEPVGDLELKGLTQPVAACYVDWEPVRPTAAGFVPFPPLLVPPTSVAYAGRRDLRAGLSTVWERVDAGGGSRLVLLAGEPGVGKTRTAAEVARDAHAGGALVLYGRCDEELALPHEPFVEALDWQTSNAPQLPLGRFAGDLRRLVPDLGRRIEDLPPAIRSDPRTEEHRLYEAAASWIAEVSRASGLVLVIDDLHWATRPTLQLLMHVGRAVLADASARVVILATYRDTDVDRSHPLQTVIGDLRRLPGVDRIPVQPLTEGEVLELIALAAGHDLDDDIRRLAARTYLETEGNPFFVGEVLRHFIETEVVRFVDGRWVVREPEHVDVPEGVRDVVSRRLDRLSDSAGGVLAAAAVIGRDFPLDLVSAVVGSPVEAVLDVLDDAVRARLVDELGPGRFRFSHALTRRTLYEELSATRRRRTHGRVVAALEEYRPSDVVGLAYHSVEAGPTGDDLRPAIGYSIAAGERALEARALGDAVAHFEQALELIQDADGDHAAAARRARCGLGEAQRDSGDPSFRETLSGVVDDALAADDLEMAVRAALGNGRIVMSVVGGIDRERVARLESVLGRLEPDTTEHLLMSATLAGELAGSPAAVDRRLALADEVERRLEGVDDPALIARVLLATDTAVAVPRRMESMRERSDRALRAADASGDPALRVVARLTRGFVLGLLGDLMAARETLLEALAVAQDEASPTMQWMARGFTDQFAGWDGDLPALRAQAQSTLELGQQIGEADALSWWGSIEGGIRWCDGTASELSPVFAALADEYPDLVAWRIYLAYALADDGDLAAAAEIVDANGLDHPDVVPEEMFTFATLSLQVAVLQLLGRRRALAQLVTRISPHRTRWSSAGTFAYLPLAVPLASCLAAAGDVAEAIAAAKEGWRSLLQAGVRYSVPRVAAFLVPTLVEIGTAEARALAETMLATGLREAEEMAMTRRVEELRELSRSRSGLVVPVAPTSS